MIHLITQAITEPAYYVLTAIEPITRLLPGLSLHTSRIAQVATPMITNLIRTRVLAMCPSRSANYVIAVEVVTSKTGSK